VSVEVRPACPDDEAWVEATLQQRWGGRVVAREEVFDLRGLPALVAWSGGRRVGVATLRCDPLDDPELMSLDSLEEGRGVGSALIEAACSWARSTGARRLRVVTTNDNLRALGLYQRRGFRLVALRPGAVDEARRYKPSIPEVSDGIPLHDELELARVLT